MLANCYSCHTFWTLSCVCILCGLMVIVKQNKCSFLCVFQTCSLFSYMYSGIAWVRIHTYTERNIFFASYKSTWYKRYQLDYYNTRPNGRRHGSVICFTKRFLQQIMFILGSFGWTRLSIVFTWGLQSTCSFAVQYV